MRGRPNWLAEKIREGERKASMATCSDCGTPVIAGPDDDVCALLVMVDVEPVGALAELRALMAGRRSYLLALGTRELWERTGFRTPPRHPVHLEHRCPGGES